jgi:hypothetical protein
MNEAGRYKIGPYIIRGDAKAPYSQYSLSFTHLAMLFGALEKVLTGC